ncbi:hypothetical protein [Tumebacillus lipolyticus]|uniref:Uncharacterized protein n=1 Tax=Tumebacillus lipolyticus TaxID=1280370 RepID=A0ABW5A0N7_9BACL
MQNTYSAQNSIPWPSAQYTPPSTSTYQPPSTNAQQESVDAMVEEVLRAEVIPYEQVPAYMQNIEEEET